MRVEQHETAIKKSNTNGKMRSVLFLISLSVIGGSVWVAWKLLLFFIRAIVGSPAPVQAAVIAGSATIAVSVTTLIVTASYQKRREIEAEHRKQKAEIYEEFIKFLFDLFPRDKLAKEALTEVQIIEFFNTFNRRMTVWGSDEVLREYLKYRANAIDIEGKDPNLFCSQLKISFMHFAGT